MIRTDLAGDSADDLIDFWESARAVGVEDFHDKRAIKFMQIAGGARQGAALLREHGAEALDMLQAMNTGHEGSLSTLHANSPRDSLARLETMVLMAGMDIPVTAVREYISSALNLIIQLGRMRDGSRRVTQITEVVGMEGDVITLQDIFEYDYRAQPSEEGDLPGKIVATGIRPSFAAHLEEVGYDLSAALFQESTPGRR